jgi:prepilin-type N-terminal cleavage/methylation domain-containing protein
MTASMRGNTLVELLVVLAVLGIIAGVTGLTFGRAPHRIAPDAADAIIANARRQALRSGSSVTVTMSSGDTLLAATAYPDGRVVADSLLAIDPLSGRALP